MPNKDNSKFRREYSDHSLNRSDLPENPLKLFEDWMSNAISGDVAEPLAMALSTANLSGKPSSRIVLLRHYSERGFVFYTNYKSRKADEILQNPLATMNFFWPEQDRQIIINGKITKTSKDESDAYFKSRPLKSQISALISDQSKPISSRDYLEDLFSKKLKEFSEKKIKRPAYWGGFCLVPDNMEFWQGRPHRLNDRIYYSKESGVWIKQRLAP